MKGLLIEKGEGWYIILTPASQYKKIKGTTAGDIGTEVKLSNTTAFTKAAALAAALLLFVTLAAAQHLLLNNRVYAYITIEANHDVEFAVDRENRVLSAQAYGSEAARLLSGIDYLGADIQKVISEFTLASLEDVGTGADEEREVVVSYYPLRRHQDEEVDNRLEQIAEEQQRTIEGKGKQIQIETVVVDKQTRKEAKSRGIPPGKLKKGETSENSEGGDSDDKKNNSIGSHKDKEEDSKGPKARDKEKEKQEKQQGKKDEKNKKQQEKEKEKAEKQQEKDNRKEEKEREKEQKELENLQKKRVNKSLHNGKGGRRK